MRIGYTKDMTNTQITAGTIVTHAIIGCYWKVVRGDDEYSTLSPYDEDAVSYMDSMDTVSMLVSNEHLIIVNVVPYNTLVTIHGAGGIWRITGTTIDSDGMLHYAIPFSSVAIAYAINERVYCRWVSENEFKRVGLIDEIVDVGTKV